MHIAGTEKYNIFAKERYKTVLAFHTKPRFKVLNPLNGIYRPLPKATVLARALYTGY